MKVLVTAHGPKKTDTNAAAEGEIAYFATDKLFCGLNSRYATSCARVVEMDITTEGLVEAHLESLRSALGGLPEDEVGMAHMTDRVTTAVVDLARIANAFSVGEMVRIKGRKIISASC